MFQKKTKEDDPEKLTHGHVFAYGMGRIARQYEQSAAKQLSAVLYDRYRQD